MTLPVIPGLALVNGLPPITCAKYGVQIVDKRNGATVARLPEVGWGLTYDYRIDRTSEAQLTVDVGPGGVGEECCAQLGRVGHWMHELSVYREGNNREVWGGPIVKLRDSPGRGQFTIQAKDRSAWWWRRALAYSLMYSGNTKADATRVFMDLLKAAEQATGSSAWKLPYDPVRLNVSGRETGVIVDGKILTASDIVMIGPEIQTLADSVIDWTVIGRTCYVGALVIELDPLPILAQEHWLELDPEIEWDGESVATQVVVMGARGIMGIWPPGPITVPRWPQYGSHTLRISDPKLTDQATATERARTMWELHQQPALCVLSAGGSLGPNAPVVPQDLVPGRVTNVGFDTSCFITGTRLAQTRANGALQYVAYDSGIARDLVVAQRITKTTVRVEDSQEVSVLVDLQPPGTADVRRPGGRSARQPVIPEPTPQGECCGILGSAALVYGGDAVLQSGAEGDYHSGSCSGDYVKMVSVGDYVQASFCVTDPDCLNLVGEDLNLDGSVFRGPFGIVGQQIGSDGAGATLQLTINGNAYTLVKDVSLSGMAGTGAVDEFDPSTWQWAYYNGDAIAADHPFVAGVNVVRLEVLDMGDQPRVEVEQFLFGQFGNDLSDGGDGCLFRDDSEPGGSPVCFSCSESCVAFACDEFCAYLPFDDPTASEVPSWGDFNDHPGNCNGLGDFVTFFSDGSGIEYSFTLTTADGFNSGWLGIVGQSYTNGAAPTLQLEVNGFSYVLSRDDAPMEGLPNFPLGDIGTGPWQFHRYNTADIVGDAPFLVGANVVRLTVTDQGGVAIDGRIEYEAMVWGPLVEEGGCMTREVACFTCPPSCNPIFGS